MISRRLYGLTHADLSRALNGTYVAPIESWLGASQ
jgi:hypothetical protein